MEVAVSLGESFVIATQNTLDDALFVAVGGIGNALQVIKVCDGARYCCELAAISSAEVKAWDQVVLTVPWMSRLWRPMTRRRSVSKLEIQSYKNVSRRRVRQPNRREFPNEQSRGCRRIGTWHYQLTA